MRTTTPLFRFDAGWLYLISGVVICMSGVLIPARANVRQLEDQLAAVRQLDTRTVAQLEGYGQFQDALDREDRGLIRRLAATQLNLMPEGDVPLLIDRSASARYADWIDASIAASFAPAAAPARSNASLLERLATGAWRFWFLGAGVLCVFVGMLMSPELDAKVVMRAADGNDIEDAFEDANEEALEDESDIEIEPENESPAGAGIATVSRAGLVARLKEPRPGCSPIAGAAGAAAVEADVPDRAAPDSVVVDDASSIPDAGEPASVEIEFAKDLFSMLSSESATPSDDASAEVEAMLPAPALDCVSVEGGLETASDQGIECHDDGARSDDEVAPDGDVEPGSSAERNGEDDEQDEYEYEYVDVDEDGEGDGDGADAEDGEDDGYEYEYVYEDVEEDDPEGDEAGEAAAEDVAEGVEDNEGVDDEEGDDDADAEDEEDEEYEEYEDDEDDGEYDEDEDDVEDDEDEDDEDDDEDLEEDADDADDDEEELAAAAADDGEVGEEADDDDGEDDDEYEYEYVYEYVDVDDDEEGEEPEDDAERASA